MERLSRNEVNGRMKKRDEGHVCLRMAVCAEVEPDTEVVAIAAGTLMGYGRRDEH